MWLSLCITQLREGKKVEAKRTSEEMLRRFVKGEDVTAHWMVSYALSLSSSGNGKYAIESAQKAVTAKGEDPWHRHVLGLAYLNAGKREDAIKITGEASLKNSSSILNGWNRAPRRILNDDWGVTSDPVT